MSLLNRYSFIVFGSVEAPEPEQLTNLPSGGAFAPTAASVLLVPGEHYQAYIPFGEQVALTPFTVSLIADTLQGASTPIGTVETVPDTEHVLLKFVVPADFGGVEGYYRLMLSRLGDVLYSNRVWLKKTDYSDISALFSFRNARPVGPIAYDVTGIFRNILRLKCSGSSPVTDTSAEVYELVTTGKKRTVSAKAHKFVKFSCPNTDHFGHEGWATLLLHKDLLINDKAYSLKTGYNEDDGQILANGTFEVYIDAYSAINRC
jgi:hypothetical protein